MLEELQRRSLGSHRLDVADEEAIKALPEKVIAQHGKIDLVFNNAGITVDSDFSNMPESDWDKVMDVNLHGVINMTRAFLPYLKERPEAAVVNTSSIFGHDCGTAPERLPRHEICRAGFYRESGKRNEGDVCTGALRAS